MGNRKGSVPESAARTLSFRCRGDLLWAEEAGEVALGALALPHLAVDTLQGGAWHGTDRHRVRETLGLQIRVVGEDPDMSELVGDDGRQLVFVYGRQKPLLERH